MYTSWAAQRAANRLPLWSDARNDRHSLLQQLITPSALAVEDLYKYAVNQSNNLFLSTANLDLLDIIYEVKLPRTYTFGIDKRNLENPTYVMPRVTAVIDSVATDLEVADDNTLDSFHYEALPTRVIDTGTSETITSIVPATVLPSLEYVTPASFPIANRLVVTMTGGTDFLDLTRIPASSFLVLHGTTLRGIEDTEFMYISYNGVFTTRNIWTSLSKVEYFGFQPDTSTIQIDVFTFGANRHLDKYLLSVDSVAEKLLYHRFTDKSYGTVHQHMNVIASTLMDLYRGVDTLQAVKEIELGWDNAGTFTNVTLHDIAVQPFTGRIFGLDDTHLYIFDPHDMDVSYQPMRGITAGAELRISAPYGNDFVRDDTAMFEPDWRRPTRRIYKNRWTVIKPDGTKVHLLIDGSETTLGGASENWIANKTYTEMAFGPFEDLSGDSISKQSFQYQLTQRGTYFIMLETTFVTGDTEVDIIPLRAHFKTALARLELPATITPGHFRQLAFDAEQNLWLCHTATGSIQKLRLVIDNMLVDVQNKVIYLHEDYGEITVYPSVDVVD